MDLSQRTEFCQQLLCFFEHFVSVSVSRVDFMYQPHKRPGPHFFENIGVLFEGAFSL